MKDIGRQQRVGAGVSRRSGVIIAMVFFLSCSGFAAMAGGQGENGSGESRSNEGREEAFRQARVEYLEGNVRIDREPAEIGAFLTPGALVTTGSDGVVEIVFGTGNALRIEENTELTLDVSDPGNGIEVTRGTFAAVFEGLETIGVGSDTTLRVRTPTTVAGVRGTAFFVKVESPESTYFCTCRGIIDFDDGAMTIRAARHEARRFVKEGEETVVRDAPEIYHDSHSLNAVADVVGVKIAWGEEP